MRKICLLACLLTTTAASAQEAKFLVGYWEGMLKIGPTGLRLGFHFSEKDGALKAKLDSIDQGAFGIPVSAVRFDKGKLELDLKDLGAKFAGTLNKEGDAIDGKFQQGGLDLNLTLKKFDKVPDRSRPQDPKRPYPYLDEDVVFENPTAKIKLAGTLTLPKEGGPHAAVVLITGSGPQNRDEALMGHRPFLVIADHLTRQGIAVLRFDDRGVGKSTGVFHEADSSDFATDARAAVEFLKTRKEIDPARIGLVGHSEGGLVAPLAAVESKDIAFIILLAGPGVTGENLVETQLKVISKLAGVGEKVIDTNLLVQRAVVAVLRKEKDDKKAAAAIKVLVDKAIEEIEADDPATGKLARKLVEAQLKPEGYRWSRFFLTHDPRPVLKKVTCPVLAINGEKDVQVDSRANLTEIAKSLAEGGNRDFTIKEFAGLNHLFQRSKTGSVAEYGLIQTTIEPEVLDFVSSWIRARYEKKSTKSEE